MPDRDTLAGLHAEVCKLLKLADSHNLTSVAIALDKARLELEGLASSQEMSDYFDAANRDTIHPK